MAESPTPGTPGPPTAASGPWARFRARHLHDYPVAARRVWLGIVGAGALTLVWAAGTILAAPASGLGALVLTLSLVALAATSAFKLPRSDHTLSVGDLFVFASLATLGPAVAVLAAGVESAVAAARTSRRLSSRLASPAAAMAAWAVCGLAFDAVTAALDRTPLADGPGVLIALATVALLPYALTTGPLLAMMALKRGEPVRLRHALSGSSWSAAVYLGSALIAGLMHLNGRSHGIGVLVAAAVVVLAVTWLLRRTLERQEVTSRAQEARVEEARQAAAVSRKRFEAAFEDASIGMALVTADGTLHRANRALGQLLGVDAAALAGRDAAGLLKPEDRPRLQAAMTAVLGGGPAFAIELQALAAGERSPWVSLHGAALDDTVLGGGLILQLHDVSQRREAEAQLAHHAYHDMLTELPNRRRLHQRLAAVLQRPDAARVASFALMVLDLDRFKTVNDSLGHRAGDALLREVARRLRDCARPTDLVARLGGDEFAVLLDDLEEPDLALRMAQRMLQALSLPAAIHGVDVPCAVSIGLTFGSGLDASVDDVLRNADLAMYEAKSRGRGRVALFDESMLARAAEKLSLEADLRRAIADDRIAVHFQPIYALQPQQPKLTGFEALARWTDPQRGVVPPGVFVPLAEDSGQVEALTERVLAQAIERLAAWQRTSPQAAGLGVNVNISTRDLSRPALVPLVRELLERHRVAPHCLTLEITETTLMDRLDAALGAMQQLRAHGVRFAIDDFGTGYSSLAYLGTLPIDGLKIDRSFVGRMHERPQDQEIVRAVLHLGRALGQRVVAEGVETAAQLQALRALGVPFAQGYGLARPMPPQQIDALISALRNAAPA
jgi:diguanylate cyclase (GGDEF)-like protein/PAS domain S-box-containing protein